MGNVLGVLSAPELAKLRNYDGSKPTAGKKVDISRYDFVAGLTDHGTLFLVADGGNTLWLVAVLWGFEPDGAGFKSLGNAVPLMDISVLRPYVRLEGPRELTTAEVKLLRFAQSKALDTLGRTKPAAFKVPKWLVAEALKPPVVPSANNKARAPLPSVKKGRHGPIIDQLAEACLAQIDEIADQVAKRPAKFFAKPEPGKTRGFFTTNVQSIFAGAVDAEEARRLLAEDLAPFAPPKEVARAVRRAEKSASDLDDVLGEVVDQFAIRAIEQLSRGMVAVALARPKDVPRSCAPFGALLDDYAQAVRALLDAL